MTGQGTPESPYIVSIFSDFLTAVGTSGAYVRLNTDIDVSLDQTYKSGLSDPITITCADCDMNGKTIKNFVVNSTNAIVFSGSVTVHNGAFLNFVHRATANGGGLSGSTTAQIIRVDFSWVQHNNYEIVIGGTFQHCSFCVTNKNNPQTNHRKTYVNPTSAYACSFYLDTDIELNDGFNWSTPQFKNLSVCGIVGKIHVCQRNYDSIYIFTKDCTNTYIAAEFTGAANFTVLAIGAYSSFIVTDISQSYAGTITYSTDDAFRGLTKAQAQDAEYLYSIGFMP